MVQIKFVLLTETHDNLTFPIPRQYSLQASALGVVSQGRQMLERFVYEQERQDVRRSARFKWCLKASNIIFSFFFANIPLVTLQYKILRAECVLGVRKRNQYR